MKAPTKQLTCKACGRRTPHGLVRQLKLAICRACCTYRDAPTARPKVVA